MKRLIIYNLETDLDSHVLAAAHDWVESFANQAAEVVVYSTHVGTYSLAKNVVVNEIGGGSPRKKVIAILRLLRSAIKEIPNRKDISVFHHMSTRSLLITGLIYRSMGVKQGLWYSHSKKSISLKISHFFANEIFTSTSNAIPISSSKINYVGHGIKTERFTNGLSNSQLSRSGVVAVGRVVPIKRLELLIDAVFNSGIQEFRITCLGPFEEEDAYPQRLKVMAKTKKVDLVLKGAIPYADIPALLINFDFVFTGTPSSVDKAVIEGALSGCFVISSEKQALKLTGMDKVFEALGSRDIPTLEVQLLTLSGLPATEKELLRSKLSARARELNDLDRTTLEILRKIESST